MCGLVGIASPRSQRVARREEIEAMLGVIAYRGPDDEAIESRPGFAAGFRRLAIVDPEYGRQPMSTEDGALHLVCNGEIYNHEELRTALAPKGHRFRTRCDSEVLLHAFREWGEDCVVRLRGIFAFAIWDATRSALFLCRDRSGVKPLFVRADGEELHFASEAKALLAHPSSPRAIDLLGCFAPAAPGALMEPSPFRGVSQLGAGCKMTFTAAANLRPKRYWSYAPTLDPGDDGEADEVVAEYREELLRVVSMQLMADVRVGACLSGGLDSSVIAAAARLQEAELPTFTSVCAGSEDPWYAFLLSKAANLRGARFVRFAPEELLEDLPRVAWAAEGAFDLGFLGRYQLAFAASRQGVKVLLSGQGADELMGGYERSYSELVASAHRAANAARLLDSGWASIASALRHSAGSETIDLVALLEREHAALSHYLLRFEDRMGMLAGVEVRVPFLDHRLVELCANIPGARRRRWFGDKGLLREAARGFVPDAVRLRPKFAFNGQLPPISQLLATVGRDTVASDLLGERAVRERAYFEPRQIDRLRLAGNYHALDAVLIVHLLDELFVSGVDPGRFEGPSVAAPEVTVDASWMPAAAVLAFARKGPSAADTPRLSRDAAQFGWLYSPVAPPGASPHSRLLAIQLNDGGRTVTPVPDWLDATVVLELLRGADGTRTYVELAASLGASVETVLAIGAFLTEEGLLEHGTFAPRS